MQEMANDEQVGSGVEVLIVEFGRHKLGLKSAAW
jgi:hypothetical protein